MTYALSESLQAAVYDKLVNDPVIGDLTSGAVFDLVPQRAPDLFVAIGPERVEGVADRSGEGAIHRIMVSVVTRREGYLSAKKVAAAISDALLDGHLALKRGRLVSIRFLRADARRDRTLAARRIDLWFRARTDQTPA